MAKQKEEQQEEVNTSPFVRATTVAPTYGEADENGFIGVAPEYANYANETEAPLEGDGTEPEQQVVDPDAQQKAADEQAQRDADAAKARADAAAEKSAAIEAAAAEQQKAADAESKTQSTQSSDI